jgi:dipeptidyl aminopeptidase/acylaminoacyl peptidase
MTIIKDIQVTGSEHRPMLTDIFYTGSTAGKPMVIYAHGFNGFKDWGNFDLIAKQFAEAGFVFVKFNFSHNGTTVEQPEDFADLDAYGNNNYTKELNDLGKIINWVQEANKDAGPICLLGHSRGGGIVILKAAEDDRVKAVVTWASVSECKTPWGSWPEERIAKWKESGVEYCVNGRTGQNMPLYYQLYENYQQNKERLDIREAIKGLTIPVLICHGSEDPAVPVQQAHQLHDWHPEAELFIVKSDHVFGRKHPWEGENLPEAMQEVVDRTMRFLLNHDSPDF